MAGANPKAKTGAPPKPKATITLRADMKADDGLDAMRERLRAAGGSSGRSAERARLRKAIADVRSIEAAYRKSPTLVDDTKRTKIGKGKDARYRLTRKPLSPEDTARNAGRMALSDRKDAARSRLEAAMADRREGQTKRAYRAPKEQQSLFAA